MNPELTKLIEQYLAGELSVEDQKIFEDRMNSNETLRTAVDQQKEIHEGAKLALQRDEIKTIGKKYHLRKNFLRGGASVLIVAAIAAASWFIYDQFIKDSYPQISDEVKAQLDKLAPIDLESQYFVIPEDGGIVLSEQGVLISVPKGAFTQNGKPYNDAVALQFQEALSGTDILQSGLSTTSNGELLETGGMVSVTGFTIDGDPLDFNPKVGVYVQVPTKDEHGDMQLFDGERQSDGSINWVKPEALGKIPAPVSISELDFYPAGYEDFLNKYRWKKNKASRDSLYLSFEEQGCGWNDREEQGPKQVIDEVVSQGGDKNELFQFADNGFRNDPREELGDVEFTFVQNENIDTIEMASADSVASASASCEAVQSPPYILPSKVLAFWKSKFNKTNLSTREFEQRMRTIHSSCNNSVLDVYTNNLDRSLKYCDDKVVAMGYSEFSKYAAENVGKLKAGNPHVKQLQRFYEKSVKQLKKRNSVLQNLEKKRRNGHDEVTRNSRAKESKRSNLRESQAFSEEFEYNLDNVYAQLGKTRGFTITSSSQGIATTLAQSAVKNIDRLVFDATSKRESATIRDPESGKIAQLTYNDFSFEVNNSDEYIKLFAYVMPYELNSYQRINGTKGKFEHALNNDIRYNIAVVGVKENGFGFFKKLNVKGGKLGTINLKEVSESKLNADVKQLNRQRNSNPIPITDELVWLRQEQKDFKEQKLRQKMRVFRSSIQCIIFPCCCESETGQGQEEDEEEGLSLADLQ